MKQLVDINNFGSTDADADDLLDVAFESHAAYVDAVEHRKPVVIGRKGSGKTAIYRKIIRTRKFDVFSYGHTFTDYPWNHHHSQGMAGVPEEQRFVHSWRYLILMTLAKILLNQDASQPWNDAALEQLQKIERFVVDSYGSRDPDITQIFNPSKRLRISPHFNIGGPIDTGFNLESVPTSELPKFFQEVNASIADSIGVCLNPTHNYFVCFDELDKGFDPNNGQYANMLVGLILAANSINLNFRDSGNKSSVVLFLRDDIYRILEFEDKNKITENAMSLIEWDVRNSPWKLKGLLERRFAATLNDGNPCCWDDVFDESQQMTGRQSKYQHILDRTFCRPRDAIKFANEVLKEYKRRNPDNKEKFQNEDIIAARVNFSEYLLKELGDEIFKHIPEHRDYLDILKSLDALQFDNKEFSKVCSLRPDLLGDSFPTNILRNLFEFSIIGYQKTGGVGGGSAFIWRYLDPTIRFDEAATSFRIHPGLMEALGLKKFKKT